MYKYEYYSIFNAPKCYTQEILITPTINSPPHIFVSTNIYTADMFYGLKQGLHLFLLKTLLSSSFSFRTPIIQLTALSKGRKRKGTRKPGADKSPGSKDKSLFQLLYNQAWNRLSNSRRSASSARVHFRARHPQSKETVRQQTRPINKLVLLSCTPNNTHTNTSISSICVLKGCVMWI